MNHSDRRHYRDHPQHRPHAIKQSPNNQQHHPLWPLHESHFAKRNQRLRPRPRITHHHRPRRCHRRQHYIRCPSAHGVIHQQSHVQRHIRVAIQRRIIKCAERRHAILPSRHLPIQHVQEPRKKDDERPSAKTSDGEHRRRDEIHHQPQKCQKVRVYAGSGQRTNDSVQQPFTSCPNRSSKRSHARASFTRNASFNQLSLSSFRKIVHQRRASGKHSPFTILLSKNSNAPSCRFSLTPRRDHPKFLTAHSAFTYD